MAMFNHLQRLFYFPSEIAGKNTPEQTEGNGRNPFVKIGDQIKLHTRSGTYRVLEIEEGYFVVTGITYKWFIKSVLEFECKWSEFRCWSRKV